MVDFKRVWGDVWRWLFRHVWRRVDCLSIVKCWQKVREDPHRLCENIFKNDNHQIPLGLIPLPISNSYLPNKSVLKHPPTKMQRNIISLRWKYFHTNISSSLRDIYTETSSTDVTLVSDDQIQFQAHKLVLSACSPVLKNLLLNNPHAHPLIYLRGVKQQELGSILQFMYHGEAAIHLNSVNMLLENAKDLQIKQL